MRSVAIGLLSIVACGILVTPRISAADQPVSQWAGTWQATGAKDCKELTCTAKRVDGVKWEAEFKGVCSKRFCINIKMTGRKVGDEIRFEGKTDLGKKNGGVYHWTGVIRGDKFTGKYEATSGKKGTFEMAPVKKRT